MIVLKHISITIFSTLIYLFHPYFIIYKIIKIHELLLL